MTGRILIADGVPTNRIVLRVKLTAAYYEVLRAGSGADALRQMAREKPDLVIVSADLPDMGGAELCRQMRAQGDAVETPVVVVTPDNDRTERLALLAAGADEVLARPVDELVLLARLRSLLRSRNAEDELRMREVTHKALGMPEAATAFAVPARVAVIPVQPEIPVRGAVTSLRASLRDRIETVTPDMALRQDYAGADVFVIVDTGTRAGSGLSLLTQLRAAPQFRQAAIVYVSRPDCRREAASALDLGAGDLLSQGLDAEELVLRLPRQIARKRTEDRLRDTVRNSVRAAVTDPLTGLYNRRYALPYLSRLAERATAHERSYALLLADIDHFKLINDTHGHAAGDAVLVEVAKRFLQNLRGADLVARIGGEEFLIAIPDAHPGAAARTAERLRGAIANAPFALPGAAAGQADVTLSIGVAVASPGARDLPETLLDKADRALYGAKGGGRNQVMLASCPAPPQLGRQGPVRAVSGGR
ncbi:diguanylate cyclase [Salipiger aestuarii]|uniref:diguanylate cyclase n=1 Tax=Salipiger aestuarii TaxID=568098 RepID=A0A327YBT7_9RHOB|nr:diguanylate cyclase [Salipiger aestuarii]KAB2541730.1 diguanylate cyclase [Salipiger aestuarii]RAK17275.1 two-component system cell cycle response regulator [Salipiger aestuarii]